MVMLIGGAVLYALFWAWYVGFRKKIAPEEVETTMALVDRAGHTTPKQREALRQFLAGDDGRDFVMVNLLHLKQPVAESRQKLDTYQKIFLGKLLRKAGHPVFFARASAGNVENVNSDAADDWGAVGMVRYRSRRDLMEMLRETVGSEHHGLKLEAMEKTFAFPASDWFIFGGPKLTVGLWVAVVALLAQLAVESL